MMKYPSISFLLILTLSFSFSISVYAVNSKKLNKIFYVDSENGNDANRGTTVNSAWKTISKVNSVVFKAGDEIYFKRGGVWYETLEVKSSGTSQNPITYGAYGPSNLPLPVIDAELIRSNCIYNYSKNNIIIKDIRMQNAIGSGALRIMYSSNVKVENCSFLVTGHGGVFIETSNNCIITGNDITSPEGDLARQTDGIYSQRNSDNLYEKNNIVLNNVNAEGHLDGIQSYIDNNLTVRDNFIFQQNPKLNGQGIYATTGSGVHTYFNNVIYCPNATASVIGFKNLTAGTGSLRAYHNTLIGKGANVISINGDASPEVKNNIFVALSSSNGIIRIDSTCVNPSNINNNVYHNGGSSISVTYRGTNLTFAQWKALGFESDGLFADPQLEPDYKLKPLSPAVNRGIEIGTICAYDKAGISRPQMGGVDVGAYESFYSQKNGEESSIPESFELAQNYPNPFNPTTVIRFTLPEASYITLKIYDILGNEIMTLAEGENPEGTYEKQFNAGNLASGTYIYQLTGKNFNLTKKMSLIK